MTVTDQKTNAVQFGKYAIVLSKEQLEYYYEGQLVRVRDVKSDFTFDDLYNHGVSIAEGRTQDPVKFVRKELIVKKLY